MATRTDEAQKKSNEIMDARDSKDLVWSLTKRLSPSSHHLTSSQSPSVSQAVYVSLVEVSVALNVGAVGAAHPGVHTDTGNHAGKMRGPSSLTSKRMSEHRR